MIENHEENHHGPIDGEKAQGEANEKITEPIDDLFNLEQSKKRKPKATQQLSVNAKKLRTDGRFECEQCGTSYARKDGLARHQKKNH